MREFGHPATAVPGAPIQRNELLRTGMQYNSKQFRSGRVSSCEVQHQQVITGSSPRRSWWAAMRVALRIGVISGFLPLASCNWSSNAQTLNFNLGGSVSGLIGTGLVLANNSATLTVSSGATSFSFGAVLTNGSDYAVSVKDSPAGLTCSVANGVGTAGPADVNNVVVTCNAQAFTLGGTISGLNGSGLVLANGTDTVAVPFNATSFALPTAVAYTSGYAVTVKVQPTGLSCNVTNGAGTMPAVNVTNVLVTCSDLPYSLGGTIAGLNGNGLVLANGSDTLTVPLNATSFTMPAKVPYASSYAVMVMTQPAGLTCTVSNGSGTMPAANVTNVSVTCSDLAFTLGGMITGLTTDGLVLANGTDTVTVPANATSFTMPAAVAFSSPYAVTVMTQPIGLTCTVSNGSGTMPANNVTNVAVTCASNVYTLGGAISGLTVSGLVLTDGTDDLSVAPNATTFTFQHGVAYASPYDVTVKTLPAGLTCTVDSGSGVMPAAPVTNVSVTCSENVYTLGGVISGLNGSGLVLANGTDSVNVPANAKKFTLPIPVAYTSPYAVTVTTQPTGLTCTVSNGSGTMPANNVTNVLVTCSDLSYNLGGTIAGLNGSGLVIANGSDTVNVLATDTSFTMPAPVAYGSNYAVSVKTQPTGLTCSVSNGSGTMPAADVTNVLVTCSDLAYTLGGLISGLSVSGLVLANGTDTVNVPANAKNFRLPTKVAYTSNYDVTVMTQPTGLTCSVSNGSGTMPAANNVTTVSVACTANSYMLGGTITNLTGSGLVLVNVSNGDTLSPNPFDTSFTMPMTVPFGASYDIEVQPSPVGQICTASSNTGTMPAADVTNVSVSCQP
jgi:hypothetical protein